MSFWKFIRTMIILDWLSDRLSGRQNQHEDSIIHPFPPDYTTGQDLFNSRSDFWGLDTDTDIMDNDVDDYPYDDL